jgi:phosphoglycolate phosphatase-like HAD superfamily hydrolase
MKSTKAIFFDFDGVLADTFEFCYEIAKSIDPPLTRKEYRDRFLGNINEHKPERTIEKKEGFDFFALYTPKLLQLKIATDVKKMILELSNKYPLFIVSSTTTDPIKKFLEQNGLGHCFKEIYGNDVHKSKIEKIRMILNKYALDPKNCLFITDTLGDIHEARKCAMDSIAVSWGYHSSETLRQGDPITVVNSLEDLIAAIDKRLG